MLFEKLLPHRADQCGAALHATVGDVFEIVGCSAVTEPGGFNGRKHHPVTALCAGEHEARQAGWRNVPLVHATNSVPVPHDPSRDQFIDPSGSAARQRRLTGDYWLIGAGGITTPDRARASRPLSVRI
jgi:hypothetical protein